MPKTKLKAKSRLALPVSVIVTVRNEEATIGALLTSLLKQTLPPAEVVITDGASNDQTLQNIKKFGKRHPQLKIMSKSFPSNRSQGRNEAIRLAKHDLIAITDAGCFPDKQWLAELVKTFVESQKNQKSQHYPVIAGYAIGQPQTSFQRAVIPYFLVMPDRVNPATYLPATRSMLIHKKTWQKMGGFDPNLSTSEDFVLAKKLVTNNVPIIFCPTATVLWSPPTSFLQTTKMFTRFAQSDVQGKVLRPKALLVFGRYILGNFLFGLILGSLGATAALIFLVTALLGYAAWAMVKNKKYVGNAWYWLPLLQVAADIGVMMGTLCGASSTTESGSA